MKIKEVVQVLEDWCPPMLQESYDNCGLLVGNADNEVSSCLISLDVTEEIILEAKESGANLIISHHPIIFKGLKRLTGSNLVERCVMLALKHDIALYAMHTSLDNLHGGVNSKIADKLGLVNKEVLSGKENHLIKLAVYVPKDHQAEVLQSMIEAGAGKIGNYTGCSFSSQGIGSFTPEEGAKPFLGKKGAVEKVEETKVEVVLEKHLMSSVLQAMKKSHPYEEVAYDLYSILNSTPNTGAGLVAELHKEMSEDEFLGHLSSSLKADVIRHSDLLGRKVKRVAVCGGSGSFLLNKAIRAKADVFVTADFTYHGFFEANEALVICDIGHYESEQFTGEIIAEFLAQNFNTFAASLAKGQRNPVNYFYK